MFHLKNGKNIREKERIPILCWLQSLKQTFSDKNSQFFVGYKFTSVMHQLTNFLEVRLDEQMCHPFHVLVRFSLLVKTLKVLNKKNKYSIH